VLVLAPVSYGNNEPTSGGHGNTLGIDVVVR
jgi:hypothetical protein